MHILHILSVHCCAIVYGFEQHTALCCKAINKRDVFRIYYTQLYYNIKDMVLKWLIGLYSIINSWLFWLSLRFKFRYKIHWICEQTQFLTPTKRSHSLNHIQRIVYIKFRSNHGALYKIYTVSCLTFYLKGDYGKQFLHTYLIQAWTLFKQNLV